MTIVCKWSIVRIDWWTIHNPHIMWASRKYQMHKPICCLSVKFRAMEQNGWVNYIGAYFLPIDIWNHRFTRNVQNRHYNYWAKCMAQKNKKYYNTNIKKSALIRPGSLSICRKTSHLLCIHIIDCTVANVSNPT